MCRGNLSGPSQLREYGSMDPAQAQLCLNGIIHDNHHQHLHERRTINNGASTWLSRNWSACTDGRVAGLQPAGSCQGRQGTSASVHARLGQATGAWCHRLAPTMTLSPHQLAAASGGQEAHPATPYHQAVHPPRQVRFAPPVTRAEATTGQSQSVAERGRPQTREQGGHQEPASCSRTRKDRSSTQGPKKRRGITSEDQMEDLMDFVLSGWKRDLIHMVRCFYASQISPLNTCQWHSNRDKFIQAMEE